VLLQPEHRRLVEALASGPESASSLAQRLGEKRQRLNYHLRLLEEAGHVELVEERWSRVPGSSLDAEHIIEASRAPAARVKHGEEQAPLFCGSFGVTDVLDPGTES
jgi:DNA-binding transcriptional ArsR family regulator